MSERTRGYPTRRRGVRGRPARRRRPRALVEAWDSGASAWNAARREAYANYLDRPERLVAVTARFNRQKADKDPAQWLPIEAVRCRYVAE
ncbi:hypothetical protein HD597_003934 [Nonomuraea thailandensis]|uniref:Uncharacterized protein n=1 Tax=Nonomuraea thailandensis TaxID=1188745 RepID=A0A9X2GG73_9ACTN|nr:hypothetical protein [Nonomuraea thailandensis]MCP2356914.1 hypothetical protein [Nonomuraea thailandensis]